MVRAVVDGIAKTHASRRHARPPLIAGVAAGRVVLPRARVAAVALPIPCASAGALAIVGAEDARHGLGMATAVGHIRA